MNTRVFSNASTKRFFDRLRSHLADVQFFLFLAAGLIGVIVQWVHPADAGDEMMRLAGNIAAHGAFSNPFRVMATGPTAMNPPLYPFVVACLIRILRLQILVYQATVIGSIVANAATAALLPRMSQLLFGDGLAGVAASVLWLFMMPCLPGWDTSFTAAGLLLFCLITAHAPHSETRPQRKVIFAGLIAGMLYLLNPSSLLIILPWMGYVVWQATQIRRQTIQNFAVITAVLMLFVVGWCSRNFVVLGAFVTRTNLGPTLYASDNDCATTTLIGEELGGCYQKHHPNTDVAEAQLMTRLGEVRYDRLRIADTETWIRSHGQEFLLLTMQRFVAFWFPRTETLPPAFAAHVIDGAGSEALQSWIHQQNEIAWAMRIATALSLFGIAAMVLDREPFIWFALAVFVVYPLLYYVVVSDMRYRYPVLWISLLAAGYLIHYLEKKSHAGATT